MADKNFSMGHDQQPVAYTNQVVIQQIMIPQSQVWTSSHNFYPLSSDLTRWTERSWRLETYQSSTSSHLLDWEFLPTAFTTNSPHVGAALEGMIYVVSWTSSLHANRHGWVVYLPRTLSRSWYFLNNLRSRPSIHIHQEEKEYCILNRTDCKLAELENFLKVYQK